MKNLTKKKKGKTKKKKIKNDKKRQKSCNYKKTMIVFY